MAGQHCKGCCIIPSVISFRLSLVLMFCISLLLADLCSCWVNEPSVLILAFIVPLALAGIVCACSLGGAFARVQRTRVGASSKRFRRDIASTACIAALLLLTWLFGALISPTSSGSDL